MALVAAAVVAGGCGASEDGVGAKPPDYARALAGAPAPLAALHRQANELLPGGVDAYEKRIAALRGYPIVVNVWASWCGPCRFEFPTLQRLSAAYGRRVAFLGVDSQDSDAAAATFLRDTPVPYPSYTDPDEQIADSLGASLGLPDTAFYDRTGRLVYLKQGPYSDHAELRGRHPPLRAGRRGRIIEIVDFFVVVALVGIALLIAELLLPTGGVLAALGAAGLVGAGVLALGDDADYADYVGPGLIALGILSLVTFFVVARKVLAAHRDEPIRTGSEELVGALAEARSALDPEGQVWIEGALWRARLAGDVGPVRVGDRVTVEAVEGLTLVVRPVAATPSADPAEEGAR